MQAGPCKPNYFINMGKVVCLQGKARGKVGSIVYAVNAGQQIAREYQPVVANPSTVPQVENRSKLKLMSQLAAAYKGSIAIRKDGMKSARNQFISENYDKVAIVGTAANVNLNHVQLTKSNLGMGGFNADRSSGNKIAVALNENMAANFDKVVYTAFRKDASGNLIALGSAVVNKDAMAGDFAGELPFTQDAVVVYAYGMKIDSERAKAAFSNMTAPSSEQVAKLIATSAEVAAGTTLSQTVGLTMMVGENTADSDDVEHFSVSVTKSGNGSVSGGGRFLAGQTAVVNATPDAEATFVAWKRNSPSGAIVSTSAQYSFEVESDIVLCAVFQGGPTPHYTIAATADPAAGGTVTGAGSKEEGSKCTLVATPKSGYVFDGWFENGELVSDNSTLTFTVNADRTLVAQFDEHTGSNFEDVKIGSTPWTQNGIAIGTQKVSGRYVGEYQSVALVNQQPKIGETLTDASHVTVTNKTFSNLGTDAKGTIWLVAGNYDNDNEQFYVYDIYEYTATKS